MYNMVYGITLLAILLFFILRSFILVKVRADTYLVLQYNMLYLPEIHFINDYQNSCVCKLVLGADASFQQTSRQFTG